MDRSGRDVALAPPSVGSEGEWDRTGPTNARRFPIPTPTLPLKERELHLWGLPVNGRAIPFADPVRRGKAGQMNPVANQD